MLSSQFGSVIEGAPIAACGRAFGSKALRARERRRRENLGAIALLGAIPIELVMNHRDILALSAVAKEPWGVDTVEAWYMPTAAALPPPSSAFGSTWAFWVAPRATTSRNSGESAET